MAKNGDRTTQNQTHIPSAKLHIFSILVPQTGYQNRDCNAESQTGFMVRSLSIISNVLMRELIGKFVK